MKSFTSVADAIFSSPSNSILPSHSSIRGAVSAWGPLCAELWGVWESVEGGDL